MEVHSAETCVAPAVVYGFLWHQHANRTKVHSEQHLTSLACALTTVATIGGIKIASHTTIVVEILQ